MANIIVHTDMLVVFDGSAPPVAQWVISVQDALEIDQQGHVGPEAVLQRMSTLLRGAAEAFVEQTNELHDIMGRAQNGTADGEDLEVLCAALEARFTIELSEPRQEVGEPVVVYYARALATIQHIRRALPQGEAPELVEMPGFVAAFVEGLENEDLREEARRHAVFSRTMRQCLSAIRVAEILLEHRSEA